MFTAFIEFSLILQTHCGQESVCTVCELCTLALYNYIQFYKYNYLWMTCLIHIVASVNSEGMTFIGMCMELLHKLLFVRKGQLQPLLNSYLFHDHH